MLINHHTKKVALPRDVGIVHALFGAKLEQRLAILFKRARRREHYPRLLDNGAKLGLLLVRLANEVRHLDSTSPGRCLAESGRELRQHSLCLCLVASAAGPFDRVAFGQEVLGSETAREAGHAKEEDIVFLLHQLPSFQRNLVTTGRATCELEYPC